MGFRQHACASVASQAECLSRGLAETYRPEVKLTECVFVLVVVYPHQNQDCKYGEQRSLLFSLSRNHKLITFQIIVATFFSPPFHARECDETQWNAVCNETHSVI